MLRSKQFIYLILAFTFFSCDKDGTYPYAIKDFREKLQPYLRKVVDEGIVMHSDSVFRHMATDAELVRLGNSEHPIIRTAAFREMLQRKSFDHFDIIMGHLDDTALVFTDAGEFGIWDRTVSDDILQEAGWKTEEAKNRTIEQVLIKHNYLRSAYTILQGLEPQEKYYPYIKDMATRPRQVDPYYQYELRFDDIEFALYELSKFRKKEDVQVIKKKLIEHARELSTVSFRLMEELPDTAYIHVLRAYHFRKFYQFSGHRPGGFTGYNADRAAPEDFIRALVVQQNEQSAGLLDTMLMYLPSRTRLPDKQNIIDEVIIAIWEHPCPAYATLRKKIRQRAEKIMERMIIIPNSTLPPIDTTARLFRWN
ncbi:hypothetical protein ACX0G7_26925 [Flavitalea antarctica]